MEAVDDIALRQLTLAQILGSGPDEGVVDAGVRRKIALHGHDVDTVRRASIDFLAGNIGRNKERRAALSRWVQAHGLTNQLGGDSMRKEDYVPELEKLTTARLASMEAEITASGPITQACIGPAQGQAGPSTAGTSSNERKRTRLDPGAVGSAPIVTPALAGVIPPERIITTAAGEAERRVTNNLTDKLESATQEIMEPVVDAIVQDLAHRVQQLLGGTRRAIEYVQDSDANREEHGVHVTDLTDA